MKEKKDTIVAAITPAGGAVAAIRLSGEEAAKITMRLTGKELDRARQATLAEIDTGTVKDHAVIIYWQGPQSYTGEDVVEIQSHGSPAVIREIIKFCIGHGARQAERGEFTRRAVLNGKQDLMQAESVPELIEAQTSGQALAAYEQLSGQGSREIRQAQEELIETAAAASAAIDYPEEDIEEESRKELEYRIKKSSGLLMRLKKSYENGKIVKEGIKVAIAGEPNAGKSTLLNALLGYDRAIVTEIPGTTRDTLEESFEYKGQKFVFIDTAGLRESEDRLEKMGMERTRAAMENCDITLLVSDSEKKPELTVFKKPVIYVQNKIDKAACGAAEKEKGRQEAENPKKQDSIKISALKKTNIDELLERIYTVANVAEIAAEKPIMGSPRQYEALQRAAESLENALRNLYTVTIDCITTDLEEAIEALGEITGAAASDEIIDKIFEKFCVGK